MFSNKIDEYEAYQFFCKLETRRVSQIITDSETLKMHLESLWYDLKKYNNQDIYTYYVVSQNTHHKPKNKKMNYFQNILKYFRRL